MTEPAPSSTATPAAPTLAKPWYHRPFMVTVLLVVFFPVGLWLMWSGKVYPMAVRVIVSVLIGMVIVGNAGGKRHRDGEQAASAGGTTSTPAPAPEVVPALDAGTVVRAYDANELGGDATYKGKRFQISGTVESVGKDILGSAYVSIDGGHPIRHVQCFLRNDAEITKATGLQPGQSITVVGRIDGLMMNVLVKDAVIK